MWQLEIGNLCKVPMENGSPQRPHILVVEDNFANQRVFSMQLARLGYTCDVVDSGIEALNALEQKAYSLILLDCQMPEMDGLQFVREVRSRVAQPWSNIAIIAVTADPVNFGQELCLRSGMDDWISKPYRSEELYIVVERWVC